MLRRSLCSKAIAMGGTALAAVMFMAATSSVVERQAPELAALMFPMNASAKARVAEAQFTRGANARMDDPAAGTRDLDRARATARRSLTDHPLNPRALRILALADPQSPGTQALLMAGNRQSRRDTLTQAYLIEFAAKDGEIGQAMDHYDAVLRRRSAYRDPAGRNLAVALSLPGVLEEVADQLPQAPSWESLLYFYVLRTPESHSSFIELHKMLDATSTIPADISAQFSNALVEQSRFDEALEIAAMAAPAPMERRAFLQETDFRTAPQSGDALPAIWPGQWITPKDTAAFLQPIHGGGALINLPSGASGLIAYRIVALEPGTYAAKVTITPESRAASAFAGSEDENTLATPAIEARLTCARSANAAPAARPSGGAATGGDPLTVGEGCEYQWLALTLTETQTRAKDIFLDAVSVQPAG